MARVFVSIGSNIDRDRHIRAALEALANHFGRLLISPVYESEAVGFDGDAFYNLVVGFDTELGVADLTTALRAIEDRNGRHRDGPRFSARTLDIDILLYGQLSGLIDAVQLPRPEILQHAFVLRPLADIAAGEVHPVVGKTYAELWRMYDQKKQQIRPIDFVWRGRLISSLNPASRATARQTDQ
ncbi:MAG: 2-amino-4-hydroxy-6-hydroxymethyldihydropteridine diphosphokinase [Porticoccaceae bacterium]